MNPFMKTSNPWAVRPVLSLCSVLVASAIAFAAEPADPAGPAKKGGKAGKGKARAAGEAGQPESSFTANTAGPDKPVFPTRPTEVGEAIGENKATPVSRIKTLEGFKIDLIYSVPGKTQGSWVNLCVDAKGRIIASDQYGGLYRFTPPAPGQQLDPAKVEKVPAKIRAVNGMAWAFGALYVGVNDYDNEIPSGLYRLTDSDGDDQLDKVELLRAMDARGDHGVHAVVPTPDGKGLYLVCGNGTKPTEAARSSQVPLLWGEDHLLPRMPDGRGFMRDVMAPGGIIYKVTPDGKTFEVFSSGYRNIFDAALNRDGELFTYDADMEYDFNTSWYRPTRICHVTSGSEFGWRNGAGKRPPFYADNLPPVIEIGPGSPTGVTFGYGAKFPAKYQNALFILDWSWGKLHAVHLQRDGSSYKATREEFLSGSPLPLTDAIIHPDGAMYVMIGGRRVQSGVYRVTYVGNESTAAAPAKSEPSTARTLRHELEAFHGRQDPRAIAAAWPQLEHPDRLVRWAARTAIEHQPVATWAERALSETKPLSRTEALLALARAGGICASHRTEKSPAMDAKLGSQILTAMEKTDWQRLDRAGRLTLLRGIEVALHRFEPADEAIKKRLLAKLDPLFPDATREFNWLLCETLVYLKSPTVAVKAMKLIADAPTQEEQIEYARSLRMLDTGWTLPLRTAYFEWFLKAANFRGGMSFSKFIEFIRNDALATLAETERTKLADVLVKTPTRKSAIENVGYAFAGRPFTDWKLEELSAAAQTGMKGRSFENGRKMFGAAACFACHRFGNEGGMTGPDLTAAGGRYSPHDLLDQIINPSKEINEQFVPTVVTKNDGSSVTGSVVNLNGDWVVINEDPSDPNQRVTIDRKEVKSIEPSKVSLMPPMLLARMTKDEILDLVAYVLSGGNANADIFKPAGGGAPKRSASQ
jgi:putative heme-binding domain-containing protein